MGQPKENGENKWISGGLNQGARWTNLRKKVKTNGFVGTKTGVGVGQPKGKRENK